MLTSIKNFTRETLALSYYLRKHNVDIADVKNGAVSFVEKNRIGSCKYRFSYSAENETLFSAVYAMLIYGLVGKKIPEIDEWKYYLDSAQGNDGVWRDKNISFRNWDNRDAEWNDIHLIPHIIYGYELINCVPPKKFSFLDKFRDIGYVEAFCNKIEFDKFWGESNGVMNYLVSMIYSRDVMGDKELDKSIRYIIDYLKHQMDSTGGLWTDKKDIQSLYEAVRGGYHVWMLMIQEGVCFDPDTIKKIIDCILALQNKFGGFNKNIIADTCHNIDCIDPLVRFSLMLPNYRKSEVEDALLKAKNYLLCNRNKDGGFCFNRMCKFRYGNDAHISKRNESNMFATWFTLLALILIEEYFSNDAILVSYLPGMEYRVKQ